MKKPIILINKVFFLVVMLLLTFSTNAVAIDHCENHEWGDWEISEEATCSKDGKKERFCIYCSAYEEEIIKATSHEWYEDEIYNDATCTENGIIKFSCLSCGATKEEILKATGHIWGNWQYYDMNNEREYSSESEVPCSGGYKYKYCENCDGHINEKILKKECNFVSKISSKGKISTPKCQKCNSTKWKSSKKFNKLLDEDSCVIELTTSDTDSKFLVTGKTRKPKVTVCAYAYDNGKFVGSFDIPKEYYKVSYSGTGRKTGTYTATVKFSGIYSGTMKLKYKVSSSPLRTTKKTILTGVNYNLKIYTGDAKIKWKSSDKKIAEVTSKGVVVSKKPGKVTITATYKGKKYKAAITVKRTPPDYGSVLYDYNTRNNYFIVKIKNNSHKTMTILRNTTNVKDADYKKFDRKITPLKAYTIKPGELKTVKFKVKGDLTWYDVTDFTLYFNFKLDGKKYNAKTNWNKVTKYKKGSKWVNSYSDYDWYQFDFRNVAF